MRLKRKLNSPQDPPEASIGGLAACVGLTARASRIASTREGVKFVGTRVPVKSLYDYLEAGDSLDEFLESFPSVSREQAIAALELAREMIEGRHFYRGQHLERWAFEIADAAGRHVATVRFADPQKPKTSHCEIQIRATEA